MLPVLPRIQRSLERRWKHILNNRCYRDTALEVARHAPSSTGPPVVFFNASTRLGGLSLNAAFSLLSSWGLRLAGTPVIQFACRGGMSRCVLGTNRSRPGKPPPCRECIAQSRAIFTAAEVDWFQYSDDAILSGRLSGLGLEDLSCFEHGGLPLGKLVLPSLRWVLRRYHLCDDENTRFLFREYILSAWNVAREFQRLVKKVNPRAVVLFNGIVFPEAVARHVARQAGICAVTHEVNLLPFSAFFSTREATFRVVDVPPDFVLSPAQKKRLDAYLEQRFQGNFTMAGIRFWPQMRRLDEGFLKKAAAFQQVVPVFTNVIFDTTQDHANTVFAHMFDWLDQVLAFIRHHPETLFVLRAHPDESRPGKESQESVAEWANRNDLVSLPNLCFVDAGEYLNSYELIQRSRFVMVYTSTIGLEASLMGAPVLMGGSARFNTPDLPTVFSPASPAEYFSRAEAMLSAEKVTVPPLLRENARRYLYYEIFRAALPFADYLREDGIWRGYVAFKPFSWEALLPQNSLTMRTIVDGILLDKPFLLPE